MSRIVQIAGDVEDSLWALDTDGQVWSGTFSGDGKFSWVRLPPLPQTNQLITTFERDKANTYWSDVNLRKAT